MPGNAQELISIILMVSWMDPVPDWANKEFDCIELYAGRARISRIARAAGYDCIAADQIYDDHPKKSSLVLNGNSGFAPLGLI